ncbi:MAG: N,N-dimethylformamidase beta subunit family domain-containing protein [Pseudomonadota bacterium]
MQSKRIVGYLDPIDVKPGEQVSVMVSGPAGETYLASLVELVSGDDRARGTGYLDLPLSSEFEASYPARHQPLVTGSFALLGRLPAMAAPGLRIWFYPTTPARPQVLLQGPDFRVALENGQLVITVCGAQLVLDERPRSHRWHHLVVTTTSNRLAAKVQIRGDGAGEPALRESEASLPLGDCSLDGGDWWLATDNPAEGGKFNGRMEAPLLEGNPETETIIAQWDFSQGFGSERFQDASGRGYEGQFYQQPTRAIKGHRWDASVQDWRQNPGHYGAVHFHEDDLADAGWSADFGFTVPASLGSGVYGVKVQLPDGEEDVMPFFVAPGAGQPRSSVALLVSTATYLAYANQRMSIGTGQFGRGARNACDQFLVENPEVGNSLYEHHLDGSGVHFSSRLRPVLNLRPRNTPWGFTADTNLTAWLRHIEQPFDVITDERLHLEGQSLLADYRVLITCTHPEYHSTIMLDSIESWLAGGGRLMYMGGNGFYWRIAYHPENPAIIEVRRAEDGTRAWMSEAGEYYHQFTGEYGGLWRRLGRTPNKLVGVGFAAQGFDGGTYYRLTGEASDPRVGFVMEGLPGTGIIGKHGTQAGGAAGEEIDRFDVSLGSPDHAIVIASSENHRPGMLRTKEEFLMTVPDPRDSAVRADMTFFETPSGGAVFSTGSISYAGSLSTNGYDNDIARLTQNVLKRFDDPTPFPYADDKS